MIRQLLQRLRSGQSGSEEASIDHYEIRYRAFDERGWQQLDLLASDPNLQIAYEEPVSAEEVRDILRSRIFPAGVYKLYPIREDGTMAEPRWTIELDDE